MLTIRYWAPSGTAGVSPLGDPANLLTELTRSERVLRSVATWCTLNSLAFRIGICSDPRDRAQQLETSLVEIERLNDRHLVHTVYIRKPWNYMHVLHRTSDRNRAERLMSSYIEIGRGIGRCENSERDLIDAARHPPYYVYILTGRVPARLQATQATAASTASPSLLGIANG